MISSSSSSSSDQGSPIAAPRKMAKNEYANLVHEVTVTSDDSTRIELSSNSSDDSDFAECYSVNADVKNAIILDVSKKIDQEPEVFVHEDEFDQENTVQLISHQIQEKFDENQEKFDQNQLKSDQNKVKFDENQDKFDQNQDNFDENQVKFDENLDKFDQKQEEPKPDQKSEQNSVPKVQQNFNQIALEAIRKSLAAKISVQEELTDKDDEDVQKIINKKPLSKTSSDSSSVTKEFQRIPSKKGQAPQPPGEKPEKSPGEKSTGKIPVPPPLPSEPLVKPAIKSSIKSSPPVQKSVQFNPETTTMTLPTPQEVEAEMAIVSYNKWMGGNGIVESSFTGQPINVPGNQKITSPSKKPVLNQPQNPEPDEIRKWTEKKKGSRSKSLPRGGSEIDEILGSSKTKPQTRLFPVLSPAEPKPVHRQSRVELYENDRKRMMRQNSKFSSIKKLFKLGSNPNLLSEESPQRRNSMDKEHEKEILERNNKIRPEIIHPLQNGGIVEVVKITPKSQTQALYEKNHAVKKNLPVKSIIKKIDNITSDSGHETSSVHSEEINSSASSDTGSSTQVKLFFAKFVILERKGAVRPKGLLSAHSVPNYRQLGRERWGIFRHFKGLLCLLRGLPIPKTQE